MIETKFPLRGTGAFGGQGALLSDKTKGFVYFFRKWVIVT